MNPLIRDFYEHQVWADAEHWRAIEVHSPAAGDKAIRDRLHHIHLVQRAFRWIVGDRQSTFTITKPEDFAALTDLKAYAREYHDEIVDFLRGLSDAQLASEVDVEWFKDPPLRLTVTEALTQCAMHSHYHRGQNATRLRELGGVPPAIDLIVWYWKGRPAANWRG